MFRLVCLLIGYIIGCLQIAYIIGKLMGKIDIREHGSGNAGTTNVIRVLGPKAGIIVFIFDIVKGMAAFLICSFLFNGSGAFFTGLEGIIPGLYGGLGVILGHDFPVHLKGRGGKGSASTIGLIFFIDWRIALICYLSGILSVALTKYISLASMLIAIILAVSLFLFSYPFEAVCIGLILAGLSCFQHRENIKRLVNRNERKFNFKKHS